MKKLFYILAIAVASSLALTACSDEDVKPAAQHPGGGMGSQDPL